MSTTNPKGARGEIRNKGIAQQRHLNRAIDAEARAEARAGRSDMEQIALLDERPGNSKRERARLKKEKR